MRIGLDGAFRIGRNANWVLGGIGMATAFPFIAAGGGAGLAAGFIAPAAITRTMVGGAVGAPAKVVTQPFKGIVQPFKAKKRRKKRRSRRKKGGIFKLPF